MSDVSYRLLLNNADFLVKLQQAQQGLLGLGQHGAIKLDLSSFQAAQNEIDRLETRLRGLNTTTITANLTAGQAGGGIPTLNTGATAQAAQMRALVTAIGEVTAALREQQAEVVANKAALTSLDPAALLVARSIKQLATEWRAGRVDAEDFNAMMGALRGQAERLAESETLGSRNAMVLATALKTAGAAMGDTARQASPVATQIEQIRREVLGTRSAYQSHNLTAKETIEALRGIRQRGNDLLPTLETGSAEWLKLNQSMRTASATMDKMYGKTPLLGIEDAMSGALSRNKQAMMGALNFASMMPGGVGGSAMMLQNGLSSLEPVMDGIKAGVSGTTVAVGGLAIGVAALGAVIGKGVSEAIPWQQQLQQISGISGIVGKDLDDLGHHLQQLSTELPLSTEQLAELARQSVMVGMHSKEGIQSYVDSMAPLAVIMRDVHGNAAGLEEVGQEIVKVLRSTGASAEETEAKFGMMVNGLVALKTQSGVAIPAVTALLSFWSSQGAHMGASITQMTALSATLVQVGARAQGAGGALTLFFQRALLAAAQGGPKLEAWAKMVGLSADATKRLIQSDPMTFLQRFVDGTKRGEEGGRTFTESLKSVGLTSQQVGRTVAEASLAMSLYGNNVRVMSAGANDQTLAFRKAQAASHDFKDESTQLNNAMKVAAQSIGMEFLPMLTHLMSNLLSHKEIIAAVAASIVQLGMSIVGIGQIAAGIAHVVWVPFAVLGEAVKTATASVLIGFDTLKSAVNQAKAGDFSGAANTAREGGQKLAANFGEGFQDVGKAVSTQLDKATKSANAGWNRLFDYAPGGKGNQRVTDAFFGGMDAGATKAKGSLDDVTHHLGAAQTAAQGASAAAGALSDKLVDLSTKFADTKMTSFQQNLKQSRDQLAAFRKEVEAQATKGTISGSEAKNLLGRADRLETRNVQSLTARQLETDKTTLDAHQREIEESRLSIIKDGAEKRRAEYDKEIDDLRSKYGPQIKEALQNAQTKGLSASQRGELLRTAGALQQEQAEAEKASAAKLASDLDDIEKDRQKKVRDSATQNLQAYSAEMEGRSTIFEQGYKRAQDAAGDDVEKRLQVERTYAPRLEALQVAARNAKLSADQQALKNQLQDDLEAAKNQGSQTAALRQQAQQRFLTSSRALEAAYASDIQGYQVAATEAVQKARADATKKFLDQDLKGVKDWTAAQLDGHAAVLRAKLKLAEADHDAPMAKVLSEALKTIADQKFDNVHQFNKDIAELPKFLTDVRDRLRELNPNLDPVQKAIRDAGKVYDDEIKKIDDKIKALIASAEKAGKPLTPAARRDVAALQGDRNELTAMKGIATNKAQMDADQKQAAQHYQFQRQELEGQLELAKTEQERQRIRAQINSLDSTRLASLPAEVKAAGQFADHQEQVNTLLHEETTLRVGLKKSGDDERSRGDAIRASQRSQLEDELALARSEEQRVAIRTQLVAHDRTELGIINSRLQVAEAEGAPLEKINDLISKRDALQKSIQQASDDDLSRTQELRSAQLGLNEAVTAYAVAVARTNADVVAAKEKGIIDAQNRADEAARLVEEARDKGDSPAHITELETAALQKQVEVLGRQKDRQEYLNSLSRDALALLESEVKLRMVADGSINDPIRAKQAELESLRRSLAENASEISTAADEASRNKLIETRNSLLADEITKQRELVQLDFQRRQSAIDLANARNKAEAQITGMSEDAVFSAQLDRDITSGKLASKREEIALAQQQGKGQTELNGLKAQEAELTGQLAEGERKVTDAVKARAELQRQLVEATEKMQRAVFSPGDSASASSELNRQGSGYLASLRQSQGAIGQYKGQIADLKAAMQGMDDYDTATHNQAIRFSQEMVAANELNIKSQLELMRGASRERADLLFAEQNSITRTLVPALTAEREAREATARAAFDYAKASATDANERTTTSAGKLKEATDALTTSIQNQRSATKALADSYRTVISNMDGVRAANDSLKKTLNDGKEGPFDSNRETDRFFAIEQRRQQAIKEAQDALASGDQERIAKTLQALDTVEKRAREQKDLLGKNGISVQLSNEGAVSGIVDAADKLGIQYDKASVELSQRADIADKEAESTNKFGEFVAQFQATVDSLRNAIPPERLERSYSAGPAGNPNGGDYNTPNRTPSTGGTRIGSQPSGSIGITVDGKPYTAIDFRTGKELPALQLAGEYRKLQDSLKGATAAEQQGIRAQMTALRKQMDDGEAKYRDSLKAPVIPPQQIAQAVATGLKQSAAQTPTATGATPPAAAGPTYKTITNNYGGNSVTIYTQPGESEDALVERVLEGLQQREDQQGGACRD